MITSELLSLFRRKVPNYHLVSPKFAKDTFSVVTCGKCKNCLHGKTYGTQRPQHNCKRVMDELMAMGESLGHSLVSEFGTCDAAKSIPEDYTDFELKSAVDAQELMPEPVFVPPSFPPVLVSEKGGLDV